MLILDPLGRVDCAPPGLTCLYWNRWKGLVEALHPPHAYSESAGKGWLKPSQARTLILDPLVRVG